MFRENRFCQLLTERSHQIGSQIENLSWAWTITQDPRYRKAARFLNSDPQVKHQRKGRADGAYRGTLLPAADSIPPLPQVAAFEKEHVHKKEPVARVYKGMAWAALADDEALPSLRMTVRGSTTAPAGHASRDQFSFKCMVNGERMIVDQHDRPGVSFTKRGNDVYGRSSASKSGLFIEGLGCDLKMDADTTEVVKGQDWNGTGNIIIDGMPSGAMGKQPGGRGR